ncbi:MAG: peptidase domain-containing ABC transporter [Rhodoferax sp.]|nr:peptidase domain-containing ABC transporter [Rhodoferax sp.]
MAPSQGPSRDQVKILAKASTGAALTDLMTVLDRTNRTKFRDQVIKPLIDQGFLVATTLAVMLVYSVKLTAIAIAAVVLYVIFRFSLFGALRAATSEQIVHLAKQETYFLESVRGVQSVKLFNRADERRVGWTNILASQFNAELKISKFTISNQTANAFLLNSERVIVIWVGALAVLDKSLTIGMLFAFLSYKEHFSQRLAALVDKAIELKMLRIHADRVADVMLTLPESTNSEIEIDASSISPSIELKNVSFRYSQGDPFVLKNVNLKIPARQFIAITGASGCGKTTLVKVLLGLVEPTEGEVLIGGVELHKLGMSNFRNMVGTVMQGDALFSGSLADNICFFDPVLDQERIEHCARLAAIHDEIVSMPMGYNSLVGDIGTGLSGGQQQRVLLARAFYKEPSILVLDEATSNLDVPNEHAVNDSVRKINLTRVVVAHRPETISMAERVVRLEDGTISSDSTDFEQEKVKLAT